MVILLGLIFLLDKSTQDQTVKISFIFFRALFYLICIYKVLANFWNFLNRLEKVLTSRDTCRTRRVPGGVSRCGLSGHVVHSHGIRRVALGVGFRDTWHARKTSGGWHSVWASGTRGMLGRHPEGGTRCGLPGHVARSEEIPRVVLGVGFRDTWHARKKYRGW